MPPDSVMIRFWRVPTATASATFSICAGLAGLPNRPRLNRPPTTVRVGGELPGARDRSCTRGTIVANDTSWPSTVTLSSEGLAMPQTMPVSVVLARPLGAQQRKDLAAADLEVDVLSASKPPCSAWRVEMEIMAVIATTIAGAARASASGVGPRQLVTRQGAAGRSRIRPWVDAGSAAVRSWRAASPGAVAGPSCKVKQADDP